MVSAALLAAVIATSTATATAISLDDALRAAADRDPELRALLAEVKAAEARGVEARALLPNPSLDAAAGPRRAGGETTTDLEVALSQPVEVAGQRGARRAAAAGALEAARARVADRRLSLAAEVRTAAGRALAAEAREALAADGVVAARRAAEATAERLRAGAAARLEANAARVEEGRARREHARARRDREEALSAFGLLVGGEVRPDATLEALAGAVGALAPAPGPGRSSHPAVAAARAEVSAARWEAALAARSAVPDLRVGASVAREEDADVLLGTVGLDLPLFRRNQAERGAAGARLARAEAALAAVERRAPEALRQAALRRDAARAEVEALRGDLLRAAEENAALAAEGHEAGKLSLLEALLLRRDAAEARRALVDALEELNAAEAALAAAAGAP
jgi:cobalt-zinc-cadmium efflux system outer membrane protein